jgi:predicted  nucleic acid-binding Zn-ribbon protein
MNITVEIGPGELCDKITILEIKAAHIAARDKLANISHELSVLRAARDAALTTSPQLDALTRQLKTINETLWRIEDEIRDCERTADFGPTFVSLARSVYRTNDQRAAIKRQINELFASAIVEEKSYARY